jgi:UDPglucose--hexose-1-phosphate uridylyltransferase
MPELRQDPASRDWIVIAAERAKRPDEFKIVKERETRPPYVATCPFCEGNEDQTPPELYACRKGEPDRPGWWVRVVPNKFPALVPAGEMTRRVESGFFRKTDGVGHHEIIIETPRHDEELAAMSTRQMEDVIFAYRQRYRELRQDLRVENIIIFRNHGRAAGTSIIHAHSQLIATPVVPNLIRDRLEAATYYYDDTGRCLLYDILNKELEVGSRIADENHTFVAFHPFAPRQPFETWIVPKNIKASFGSIDDEEARQFARILQRALYRLYVGLNDPDFNFVIHTAPVRDENRSYYAWYMQVLPRMSTPAGFEIGSGMTINTTFPEETAAFMRNIEVPEPAVTL